MNRFLADGIFETGLEKVLSLEESHHAVNVLRVVPGEEVLLIDGRGTLAQALVSKIQAKRVHTSIRSVQNRPKPPALGLAFGIPKGPAQEFIIKRCSEVGVTHFQPLVTHHSQPGLYWNKERWARIVAEVSKQCERLYFPELGEPLPILDWLAKVDLGTQLYFCFENIRNECVINLDTTSPFLLVGAEGGWSGPEAKAILSAGATPLGLGMNRLRAETAALVGAAILQHRRML